MVDTIHVTQYLILLERCLYVICSLTAVSKSWGMGHSRRRGSSSRNVQVQIASNWHLPSTQAWPGPIVPITNVLRSGSEPPPVSTPLSLVSRHGGPRFRARRTGYIERNHPRGTVSPMECIFVTTSPGCSLSRGSTVLSTRTKAFVVITIFVKLGRNERLVSLSHQFSSRK